MGKRGPKPQWTMQFAFEIGENLLSQLDQEVDIRETNRAKIIREAIDDYFTDPNTVIVLPTRVPGEAIVRTNYGVSTEQSELIVARAELLQVAPSRVGAFAVALRYNEQPLVEVRLAVQQSIQGSAGIPAIF